MKSGKFLITKENIYTHLLKPNGDIELNELGNIQDFEFQANYSEIFDKIGKFSKEAGHNSQFLLPNGDFLYLFSFLEPLKVNPNKEKYFGTPMTYNEVFFEKNENVLKRSIDNIIHFYASNLDKFNSIATNVSTNNYNDFCNNITSKEFLSLLIKDSNNITGILENIIFLEKVGFFGGIKTVFIYAYIKHKGILYPVNINDIGKYEQIESTGYTASDILIFTKEFKKFNRLYYFMFLHGYEDYYKQLAIEPYTYKDLNDFFRKYFINKAF